jgi:hypothetical protein
MPLGYSSYERLGEVSVGKNGEEMATLVPLAYVRYVETIDNIMTDA